MRLRTLALVVLFALLGLSCGRKVEARVRDGSVLADPNGPPALLKAALALAGKPYDPCFEWTDDLVHCSELVWKAYERVISPASIFDSPLLQDVP